MNVRLNLGGLLGALVGGGVSLAVVLRSGNLEGLAMELVIPGLILGAVAGNFLWGWIVPKPPVKPPADKEPRANNAAADGPSRRRWRQ
jgi:hypothetical protein